MTSADEQGARGRRTPFADSGVLLLDKPSGITTFDLIRALRRRFGFKRIGHTGTLDPLATGVVVLCLNEATKLARYLSDGDKTYECTMSLGERRDTLDGDGEVVDTAPVPALTDEDLRRALGGFEGAIRQIPPRYSAVKVKGQSLHKYTRRGETPEVAERAAWVRSAELLGGEGASWSFRAAVSGGTYIRALVDDLGVALGTFAYVSQLRRTVNSGFDVDRACSVDALLSPEDVLGALIAPHEALNHLPELRPGPEALAFFRQGGFIECPASLVDCDQPIRVADERAELVGIGRVIETRSGDPCVKPERLLNP
jgi:tRNA pseudouridine55 synthase